MRLDINIAKHDRSFLLMHGKKLLYKKSISLLADIENVIFQQDQAREKKGCGRL